MTQISRKAIGNILIILGSLGILDFLFLTLLGARPNLGVLFPLFMGTLFIGYGIYLKKRNGALFTLRNIYLKRTILITSCLFIVSFLLIEGLILSGVRPDKAEEVDYMIILGAGLKGDQLTITFQNRLDKGIEYLNNNPNIKAVVSGGQGYGETITEAEAMERYLMANGIPEHRIIKEERATSTMENFKFSKNLLTRKDDGHKIRLMVVTSDFHMFRAKMLGRRNGFIVYGLPAKTWPGALPNNCIREYFAIIKSFIFDR